jgi:hypothetical protein
MVFEIVQPVVLFQNVHDQLVDDEKIHIVEIEKKMLENNVMIIII